MKRFIISSIGFLSSIAFFCIVYIGIFNASASTLGILWIFFILYGLCMGFGWKSMDKIKMYEQRAVHFGLTQKDYPKILLFSLTSLVPAYLCVVLLSMIPLYRYEVWFMTVFPCVFFNCLPASTMLGEYYGLTRKKLPFILWFVFILAACCVTGAVLSSTVMAKLTRL